MSASRHPARTRSAPGEGLIESNDQSCVIPAPGVVRTMASSCLLIAAVVLTVAATAAEPDASRGAQILAPLKQNLKAALIDGLANGPEAAVTVCRDEAPAIAAALSVNGVKLGRSSHRLRNPNNAAPEWLRPVLERYVADAGKRESTLVALPDGRTGYVEPIVLQPMCLACHGADLAPSVAETINREYPDDQATGFAIGDLRGVYWVEYPTTD